MSEVKLHSELEKMSDPSPVSPLTDTLSLRERAVLAGYVRDSSPLQGERVVAEGDRVRGVGTF